MTRLLLLFVAAGIGAAITGSTSADEITRQYDLQFSDADDSAGQCDLYLPMAKEDQLRPVVVVIHGGAWMTGDKWTMAGHCNALAKQGYAVVCVNYRLAPAFKFPTQVDDIRTALLWIKGQSEKLKLDLTRLGVFGYSAGGHLASLVAVLADEPIQKQTRASAWPADDPRWKQLPKIKTVCVGGPPCDFRVLPPANTSMAYFLGGSRQDKPSVYEAASPTANVSAGDPPIQVVHGEKDLLVGVGSSKAFVKELKNAGVTCGLKVIPGQGHMLTFIHPQLKQTMVDWFAKTL